MGVTVVMLMLAMLIMVMMAAMILVVRVRCMIMRIVMVMRLMFVGVFVTMAVVRSMAGVGIGAALGIERRLDLDNACAQSLHHGFDDMIAPDPQAFAGDLRRQMAIAEMPGDPDQMVRIDAADLHQRLRRRDHLDQPVIVEHQRIATAQRHRVFEVEQEFKPSCARHRHPPPVPIVEIENDRIGRRLGPAVLSENFGGADHRNLRVDG
jgi:hypothetical protein